MTNVKKRKDKFVDYYNLLNIPKDAELEDIEIAYSILKKDAIEEDTPLSKKRLELLQSAIILLLDPELKTEYDLNYEDNLNQQKTEAPKRSFIDFTKIRQSQQSDWESLINVQQPLGAMVEELIGLHALLPNSEVQSKILATQLLAPTALCNCLPIVFFNGVSGSGKTQLIQLARNLWGTLDTLNAESSGKSIRNEVEENKYHVPGYVNSEKVIHGVVFDDASSRTFRANPYLFGLLKGGYIRGSDVMSIAMKEGGNIKFSVFGSRAFSSIAPIASMPEFVELARRMLVIHTAKSNKANVIVPEMFQWSSLNQRIVEFWETPEHSKEFAAILSELTDRVRRGLLVSKSSSTEVTVSLSLLAAGIVTGVWEDVGTAIACVDKYWAYCKQKSEAKKSATLTQIHDFIDRKKNQAMADDVPLLFTNKELIRRLGQLERDNYLDDRYSTAQVAEVVKQQGLVLIDGFWRLE